MNAVDMRRIEQTGSIGEAGTGDILRSIESSRLTARIWFETEIGVGQIAFHEGSVVVAEVGPLRRRAALLRILGMTDGQYSIEHAAVPAGPPIVPSIESALATLAERQNEWRQLCESTPPMSAVLRLTALGRETKRKAKGAERLVYLLVDGRRSLMEILSEATVDPIEALRIVVRGESDGHFEEASIPSTLYPLPPDELSGEVPKLPQPPSIPQFGGVTTAPSVAAPMSSNELALRKSTLVGLGTDFSSSAPPPARAVSDSIQMSPIIELAGDGASSASASDGSMAVRPPVEPVPAQRRVLGTSSAPPRDSDSAPVSEPADSLIGSEVPMREPEAVDAKSRVRYVGRYEVIHRIGRGGMGSVYLSRLTTEGGFRRLFALKLLRSYLSRDSDAAEAFLAEARLAGQLHHTNVVGVVDAGVHRGQPFLVMDYVEGCSLKQLLTATTEDRSSRLIVPIILDALAGLHALHSLPGDDGSPLEVVHCDVSPENLLVGTDGVCRLTDFGVARRSKVDGGHSTHGKPGYLAPEQVTGAPIDRRVDIFRNGRSSLVGIDWGTSLSRGHRR
ncbi:MAG: protein kinase [Polyangiaceae bacterium]